MMQPRLFAVLMLLLTPASTLGCGAVLISGFDDVVRQADNTGWMRAARRLMQPDTTYAGMPELYQAMACPRGEPPLIVVSAITHVLFPRARRFLAHSGFPPAKLEFRRWLLDWSPRRFRRARIEVWLAHYPSRRFVFVFDNSATSVALSRDLLEAHRTRATIYLRETVPRAHPPGVTTFLTAFDIAANEFAAGRLRAVDAARVADAILAATDPQRVIPEYSHCPTSLPVCRSNDAALARQCARVRARVLEICSARDARVQPAGQDSTLSARSTPRT